MPEFIPWASAESDFPKQAAQAIRKIGEIGWKPTTIISNVSASISGVLEPADRGQHPEGVGGIGLVAGQTGADHRHFQLPCRAVDAGAPAGDGRRV